MATDERGDNRRPYVARSLSELVPGVTKAAYRKKSPAGAELMSEWPRIVGPRLAAETQPRRLSGTQLTIACSGPMAMELQHLASAVIERINTHAGRKLVERLRFVQEHFAGAVATAPRIVQAPEAIEGMPPGELNDALARLRAAMKSK